MDCSHSNSLTSDSRYFKILAVQWTVSRTVTDLRDAPCPHRRRHSTSACKYPRDIRCLSNSRWFAGRSVEISSLQIHNFYANISTSPLHLARRCESKQAVTSPALAPRPVKSLLQSVTWKRWKRLACGWPKNGHPVIRSSATGGIKNHKDMTSDTT